METITLGVKGMHCGGCVKSVTDALSKLPGIQQVDVSLEHSNATIGYDPDKVGPDQFREAIEETGFDVA
jgi:copper chaperone